MMIHRCVRRSLALLGLVAIVGIAGGIATPAQARVFIGFGFAPWGYYDPWYGPDAYGPPVVYGPPPTIIAPAPGYASAPAPITGAAPPPPTWYYCDQPAGYYPYVQRCTTQWRQVAARPTP